MTEYEVDAYYKIKGCLNEWKRGRAVFYLKDRIMTLSYIYNPSVQNDDIIANNELNHPVEKLIIEGLDHSQYHDVEISFSTDGHIIEDLIILGNISHLNLYGMTNLLVRNVWVYGHLSLIFVRNAVIERIRVPKSIHTIQSYNTADIIGLEKLSKERSDLRVELYSYMS